MIEWNGDEEAIDHAMAKQTASKKLREGGRPKYEKRDGRHDPL